MPRKKYRLNKKDDLKKMLPAQNIEGKQMLTGESNMSAASRIKQHIRDRVKPVGFFYFLEYYHLKPIILKNGYESVLERSVDLGFTADAPWDREDENDLTFTLGIRSPYSSEKFYTAHFNFNEKTGIIECGSNEQTWTMNQGLEGFVEESLCFLEPRPRENGISKISEGSWKILANLGSMRNAKISLITFGKKKSEILLKRGVMKRIELKEPVLSHLELVEEAVLMLKCHESEHILRVIGANYINGVSIFIEACPVSLYCFLLTNKGKIEQLDKLKWTKQTAAGVAHMNNVGIIHRNLRTTSCFLDENKNLKIGGFEYAAHKEVHEEPCECARHSEFSSNYKYNKSSLRWMSPETITHNTYGMPSEVWSYGILTMEIYSEGQRPYPGLSDIMVRNFLNLNITANSSKEKTLKLKTPAGCPMKIVSLIESCLFREANDRAEISDISVQLEILYKELI